MSELIAMLGIDESWIFPSVLIVIGIIGFILDRLNHSVSVIVVIVIGVIYTLSHYAGAQVEDVKKEAFKIADQVVHRVSTLYEDIKIMTADEHENTFSEGDRSSKDKNRSLIEENHSLDVKKNETKDSTDINTSQKRYFIHNKQSF